MGSTPLGYCWFIYKIGARTGRLTGQFETYAQSIRWEHEEEWRIGAQEKTLELDPTTGLYFYPFKNQLKLREILIGVRCEEENIERRFERLIDDDKYPDPKPEIIRTRLSSSSFKIEKAT